MPESEVKYSHDGKTARTYWLSNELVEVIRIAAHAFQMSKEQFVSNALTEWTRANAPEAWRTVEKINAGEEEDEVNLSNYGTVYYAEAEDRVVVEPPDAGDGSR